MSISNQLVKNGFFSLYQQKILDNLGCDYSPNKPWKGDIALHAYPSLNAISAQINGCRGYQEDFYKIELTKIDGISHVADKDDFFIKILLSSFGKLEISIKENLYPYSQFQGSTAVISLLIENILYTANVGDSTAFLATQSEIKQLTIRHNPNPHFNQAEIDRIIASGGAVTPNDSIWKNRLWCDRFKNNPEDSLAISRAFGDVDCEAYGLSHVPDFTRIQIIDTDKLIQCADGITDYMTSLEMNNHMLEKNISNAVHNIMQKVAELGAHDNATIQIVEMKKLPPNEIAIFAIFDGHGGSKVSSFLSDNFVNIIIKEIIEFIS